MESRRIFVVGSLNVDLVQSTPRLPVPGETLAGGALQTHPGGKGANQAYAAARMGGRVAMIGQVGGDGFADVPLRSLTAASVDVSAVGRDEEATGVAFIFVLPDGRNSIVIAPGANQTLTSEIVAARLGTPPPESLLLCQLEVPFETVKRAMRIARAAGATTILDPAPVHPRTSELLTLASIVTPNETEALQLLGSEQGALAPSDVGDAARAIRRMGAEAVVITLGDRGAYVASAELDRLFAAPQVDVVDTTAAGDVFNGTLGASLAAGLTLDQAVERACIAGALSASRAGAQPSAPTLAEVLAFSGS